MRLFLAALLLCLPLPLAAAVIEGRVVDGDAPLPGVAVTAYGDLDFSGTPLAVSAPTAADGTFRLDLPPGRYALYGRTADGTRFAFCGRNPVVLEDDRARTWAGLQAVPVAAVRVAAYDDAYSGAIEGVVQQDGAPVAGARVYLYLDVAEDLKGQGYRMSLPTAADGLFRFDNLPESDYFLVARKRLSGARVGPVLEGDSYGVFPGNPLTASSGEVQQVVLPMVSKQQEAVGSELFGRSAGPVLRGTVTDAAGQPVAGVHVFAYVDRVIGHQRPAAISAPTGADGRFTVSLPAAGTYYVGARERYGDSPAPGELFGMYEASADHGLRVAADEALEEIRIVVELIDIY